MSDVTPDAPRSTSDLQAPIHVTEIVTRNGERILCPSTGITVFVGGNNAGKSTLLREIGQLLASELHHAYQGEHLTLQALRVRKNAEGPDFEAWLRAHTEVLDKGRLGPRVHRPPGSGEGVPLQAVLTAWQQLNSDNPRLGSAARFILHQPEIGNRIGALSEGQQRRSPAEPASQFVDYFQFSPKLFEVFSKLTQRIFRTPLTLDYNIGRIAIRVGEQDIPAPRIGEAAPEYWESIESLPRLENQGDGMRNLLGLVLPVLNTHFPIMLIDEPEAYLHPPQARELGRILAAIARDKGAQILVATHDRNFLIGLLDADAPLTVVHLDRSTTDVPKVAQLSADRLRELWSDPIVRHSNVLDGLFSRLVIVTEADGDSRFLTAALEDADEREQLRLAPSEVLFVSSNGKQGMAKVISIFAELGVRAVASPDLDILNDASILAGLVHSLGSDWRDFENDYAKATQQFREDRGLPRCSDVLNAVQALLSQVPGRPFDHDMRQQLLTQIRTRENPWTALKKHGIEAFDIGASRAAATRLLDRLEEIGVCALRVGELENLAPTLAVRKGPRWLTEALTDNAHRGARAQAHIASLIRSSRA